MTVLYLSLSLCGGGVDGGAVVEFVLEVEEEVPDLLLSMALKVDSYCISS